MLDCLRRNELTYRGETVTRFERAVAGFLGVKHCLATCNGTAALYAAYKTAFGCLSEVGEPRYVAVSPMTYAATVSQLVLLGFTPLYVDCLESFQMNPHRLVDALDRFERQLCGVVVPAVYADAPDMAWLRKVCDVYKVPLVEDAAEAFGCLQQGRAVGTFGDFGCFSFFANKVVTTGEGGCVVTNDDNLAERVRRFANHCTGRNYWHDGAGCNFRMPALSAAVGLAQLEEADDIIASKRFIAAFYREHLKAAPVRPSGTERSSEWMPVFRLPGWLEYEELRSRCETLGVETRPTFKPLHKMPGLRGFDPFGCPVAESLRGFILPCHPALEEGDLEAIVEAVNAVLDPW